MRAGEQDCAVRSTGEGHGVAWLHLSAQHTDLEASWQDVAEHHQRLRIDSFRGWIPLPAHGP